MNFVSMVNCCEVSAVCMDFFSGGMGGGRGEGFSVGWGGIDCVLTEIRKRGKLSGNMHYYKKCPRQPRFLFSFFFPSSFLFP